MTKIKARRRRRPVKRVSLTELAIKQIELMLVAELELRGKRIPSASTLRKMAERYHKEHFGSGRFK